MSQILGGSVSYEQKENLKINKKVAQLVQSQSKVNWGDLLVQDMIYVIKILEASPIKYDFAQINEFVSMVYNKHSKSLKSITQDKYQQILKVLIHKASDDHTGLRFFQNNFKYAGFTSIFDIKTKVLITKPQREDIKSKGNVSKYMLDHVTELLDKDLKDMNLVVDVVTDVELMSLMQNGDIITQINGKPALKYLLKVSNYCERKTNSQLYNFQKIALRLGIYNYFFPISTITIERPKSRPKLTRQITLTYDSMNPYLKFYDLPFKQYFSQKMHVNPVDPRYFFNLIDQRTAYIRIPVFVADDHFESLFKKIELFKRSPKKTLELFVIDVRGNTGGCACCESNLISHLVDQSLQALTLNYQVVQSVREFFALESYKQDLAYVSTDLKASITEKKKLILNIKQRLENELQHAKKGEVFKVIVHEEFDPDKEWTKNSDKLMALQLQQANLMIKGQRPSIVILTDQVCRSACSTFAKFMSLFPHVIVVGRQVQGFNMSGNNITHNLPSGQGIIFIPTRYFQYEPSIEKFLRKTLNPTILVPNHHFPKTPKDTAEWILINKNLFIQKTLKQSKDLINLHKGK